MGSEHSAGLAPVAESPGEDHRAQEMAFPALTISCPAEVIAEIARFTVVSGDGHSVPNRSRKVRIDLFQALLHLQGLSDIVVVREMDRVRFRLPLAPEHFGSALLSAWEGIRRVVEDCRLDSQLEHMASRAREGNVAVVWDEIKTVGEIADGIFWKFIGARVKGRVLKNRELSNQLAGFWELARVLRYADQVGWDALPTLDRSAALENYLATLEYHLPAIARRKFDSEDLQKGWVWEMKHAVGGLRQKLFGRVEGIAAEPAATLAEEAPRTDLLEGKEWAADVRGNPVKIDFPALDGHILIDVQTGGGKTTCAMALADVAIEQGMHVVVVGHDRKWSRKLPFHKSVVLYNELDPRVVLENQFILVYVDRGFPEIDRRVFNPLLDYLVSLPEADRKFILLIVEEAGLYDTPGLMGHLSEGRKYGETVLVIALRAQVITATARGQCFLWLVGQITEPDFKTFAEPYGPEAARRLVNLKRHHFMALGPYIENPFVFRVTRQVGLGPELSVAELLKLAWSAPPKQGRDGPAEPTEGGLETYRRIIREELKGRLPSVNALVKKAREWRGRGVAVETSWPSIQRAVDRLRDAKELVESPDGGWLLREVPGASH